MKTILTAVLLLISAQTYAQVRPGTGPSVTLKSFEVVQAELVNDLTQSSTQCGDKKFKSYQSLLDVYFQHQVVQQMSQMDKVKPEVDCSDKETVVSAEVKCLFGLNSSKESLKSLLENKNSFKRHFENEQSLSSKEAEALFNYYVKVRKEIDPDAKKPK